MTVGLADPSSRLPSATTLEVAKRTILARTCPTEGAQPSTTRPGGRGVAQNIVPMPASTPSGPSQELGLGRKAAVASIAVTRPLGVAQASRGQGLAAGEKKATPSASLCGVHGDGARRGTRGPATGRRREVPIGAASTTQPVRAKVALALGLRMGEVRPSTRTEGAGTSGLRPVDHARRRQGRRQIRRRVPASIPRHDGLASNDGTASEGAPGGRTQVCRPTPLLEATGPATIAKPASLGVARHPGLAHALILGLRRILDVPSLPLHAEAVRPRGETVGLAPHVPQEVPVVEGAQGLGYAATAAVPATA